MKKMVFCLCLIGLMLVCQISYSSPLRREMDIYLCIGQSNMAGRAVIPDSLLEDTLANVWLLDEAGNFEPASLPFNKYSNIRKDISMQKLGPVWTFAQSIAQEGHHVGLVVNARGGSAIQQWERGQLLYEETVKRLKQALQWGRLKGILWHQGESNCSGSDKISTNEYKKRLIELMDNLRTEVGDRTIPVIVGQLGQWRWTDENDIRNFNRMLATIPDVLSCSACVSSEELEAAFPGTTDPHFGTEAQLELGRRYATALFDLNQRQNDECKKSLRVLFIGDSITDGNWGNNNRGSASSQRSLWDMNHIYGSGYMYLCATHYQSEYPFKEHQFFNRGISGNTLDDLEKRWKEDVIRLNPDVLSVLIGTNDVNRFLKKGGKTFDWEAWENKYRSLLENARKENPDLKLVLGAPFVANTGKMKETSDFELREELIEQCALIVQRIAKDYNAVYLPYDKLFRQLQEKYVVYPESTYWIWDGIHPTPAGHAKMAELWLKKTRVFFK